MLYIVVSIVVYIFHLIYKFIFEHLLMNAIGAF